MTIISHQFNNPKDNTKTIKIRFSNARDYEKMMDFYDVHKHNTIDVREENLTKKAIDAGRFILFEYEDGSLCVSSAAYLYEGHNGPEQWVEIGTTRAILPSGYNVIPLMVPAQVFMDFLTGKPADCFFVTTEENNTAVKHLLGTVTGWKYFTPPDDLKRKVDDTKDWTNGTERLWLCARPHTLPHQARLLLKYIDEEKMTNKKTGEVIALDFSETLFNDPGSLQKLRTIANGPFALWLESDPHRSMKDAKKALDQYMVTRKLPPMQPPIQPQ